MKFAVEKFDHFVVIEPLVTALDSRAARELKGEFMLRNTGGWRNIVLDMGQVLKTDEGGIRIGLLARRLCGAAGGLFILVQLNASVLQYVKSLGLDRYFIIADNLKDARDLIYAHELRDATKGGQN